MVDEGCSESCEKDGQPLPELYDPDEGDWTCKGTVGQVTLVGFYKPWRASMSM